MLTRRLLTTPDRSRASLEAGLTVCDGDGRLLATGYGRGGRDAPSWTWRSPLLGTFHVEPAGVQPPRWFVTRPDGAPFGQLELQGRLLWRRLEVSDGRGLHLLVSPDGTVREPDGSPVARLRRQGGEAVVVDGDLPAAWRTLLVAASALLDDA